MKLLLHKMWSDLRDSRWAWMGWNAVLVSQVVCCGLFFHGHISQAAHWIAAVLWWGQIGVGALFVNDLFQIDRLQQRQAFWLNRPIRPLTLLLGKTLLAMLGLLLPLLTGRIACQAILGMPLIDFGDWPWAVLWALFSISLIGVWNWAQPKRWHTGFTISLLAIIILIGPKMLYEVWRLIALNSEESSDAFLKMLGLLNDQLHRCWREPVGILVMTCFLFGLLSLICKQQRPLSLLMLLLGVPALNSFWLWDLASKINPLVETPAKALATTTFETCGLTAFYPYPSTVFDPFGNPSPESIRKITPEFTPLKKPNRDGGTDLVLSIKPPLRMKAPQEFAIQHTWERLSLVLPVGVEPPVQTRIILELDEPFLAPDQADLIRKGFPPLTATLVANAYRPKIAPWITKITPERTSHSIEQPPHLATIRFGRYYLWDEITRLVPFTGGSGSFPIREGLRGQWNAKGYQIMAAHALSGNPFKILTQAVEIRGSNCDWSHLIPFLQYESSAESHDWLKLPLTTVDKLIYGSSYFYDSDGRPHDIAFKSPDARWLVELGTPHGETVNIEASFVIPDQWQKGAVQPADSAK